MLFIKLTASKRGRHGKGRNKRNKKGKNKSKNKQWQTGPSEASKNSGREAKDKTVRKRGDD